MAERRVGGGGGWGGEGGGIVRGVWREGGREWNY